MFTEDDLLAVSGLQHLAFCQRQWALIYLEGIWRENQLTAEGKALHERVDERHAESRPGVFSSSGLDIRSLRLGLSGRADMVEFHRLPESAAKGIVLPGRPGRWVPYPIEYKRGKPKLDACDLVQLCAQALCLEEMLGTDVPEGALFYFQVRRRSTVLFDSTLRAQTEDAAAGIRRLYRQRLTPPPVYERKCRGCSLIDLCMPRKLAGRFPVAAYLNAAAVP